MVEVYQMSKIGRKPIPLSSAKVEVTGNKVLVSGAKAKFEHELPEELSAKVEDSSLVISAKDTTRAVCMKWGLHRALLANKISGVEKGFEQGVKIVGLGYKAQQSGNKLTLFLGFSHKQEFVLPDGVTVDIDKTGQNLTFKSHDKSLLGGVCDELRRLKKPEPYKGTGIMWADERIIRKAGKTGV
jgi:large subunit ribosomal protein L6